MEANTVNSLLRQVRAVPSGSLIIYVWHASKERGNLVYPDEIAREVANAARVPVYGTSDFYVGTGVVGGVMRRTRETGTRVGELASLILNGARPRELPIEMARTLPIFDSRQIQRWQINPLRLPSDADVRFRTPTFWETYDVYVVAVAGVVVAQLLLIAALLAQRTQRQGAEEVIRNGETTLRRSYERIRQLARHLINAQEATRADIARDLHDGVCQQLAGVSLEVSALKSSSGKIQDERTQRHLSKIQMETRAVYEDIRRLSHELHPATLQLLGLASALKTHCLEVQKRYAVQVRFIAVGQVGSLHPDMAVDLFRIAQESLRNGIEHGHARKFTVSVSIVDEDAELTISDDGDGFDVDEMRSAVKGLGLVSIEERVHAFGGLVDVISAPHRGTTVYVRAPARLVRPSTSAAADYA
jgi:signal transduction histidine kinase